MPEPHMPIRPRRSALFMPASNARALEKARTLDCDVVILDLEDAVAPEQKVAARQSVVDAVQRGGWGPREVVVRVNSIGSPWHHDDLAVVAAVDLDAILLPKVETPFDLKGVGGALAAAGAPERVRVWAMIETPRAVLNALAIAETAVRQPECRLGCLVIGTNDLAKETRAAQTAGREPMLFALSSTLYAARAHGLDVLDGVFNDFKDIEGCRREAEQGRALGMDGKTLIHPGQIAVANAAFSPSPAEVAAARDIVAAFERPEAIGLGVIALDGRMVERMHLAMAQRTIAIAEAIAARRPA